MTEKNQWAKVFRGNYFLHVDYRDSKSLKTLEAQKDAEQVLAEISIFPYRNRETIPNDFEFPLNTLEGQEHEDVLYQLQAIETNCLKLSEILDSVSAGTVKEEFESLILYASDSKFKRYVDDSLKAAIEASRCQQAAFNVSNDPARRQHEEENDPDPENLGSISNVFDSYRIAGYSLVLDHMVKIAQQAQASSQSAQEKMSEVLEKTKQAQEAAHLAEEKAAQLQKQVDETTKRVDELTEQAADAATKANNAWDKVQNTTDEAKNLIPNMLTILGIFVAIIIAVVGCYLSVLLNTYTEDPATVSLATCLVMGHILVNIIFLLLYFISKLTNRQIACYCYKANTEDCTACVKRCTWFSRMWIRYPVIVMLNSVFVVGYYILFLFQVVLSIYPNVQLLCWLRALPGWAVALIIGALILVLITVLAIVIVTLNRTVTKTEIQPPAVPEGDESFVSSQGKSQGT